MTETEVAYVDLGSTDAPDNKEKVYVQPGYRKLKVAGFTYTKEEEGKTPLIIMKCTAEDKDGNEMELNENFYMSGKLNKSGVMSSVVRCQELFKGLTGDEKMTIKPAAYTYTKKEKDGSSQTFTIPDPQTICDYLNKKCTGKTAVFKVGGQIGSDGKVYSSLTYSSFLYYTNKQKELCRYKEERDFDDSEYKYAVTKRKEIEAPAHNGGIANESQMDAL